MFGRCIVATAKWHWKITFFTAILILSRPHENPLYNDFSLNCICIESEIMSFLITPSVSKLWWTHAHVCVCTKPSCEPNCTCLSRLSNRHTCEQFSLQNNKDVIIIHCSGYENDTTYFSRRSNLVRICNFNQFRKKKMPS